MPSLSVDVFSGSQLGYLNVLLAIGSAEQTGKPPLFYAAFSEDLPICKELVDKGANVNAHDEQQLRSLMAAAKKGSTEICEFLLKKGADPKFCDTAGHDALSYGLDSGFNNLQDEFNRTPTQAQWSVNQQDTGTNNQIEQTKADVGEAAAAALTPEVVVEKGEPEVPIDKELEEENEHINQDLKRITAEHKRLQEPTIP